MVRANFLKVLAIVHWINIYDYAENIFSKVVLWIRMAEGVNVALYFCVFEPSTQIVLVFCL